MSVPDLYRAIREAKGRADQAALRLGQRRNRTTPEEMMRAVGNLHRAWDEMSDALFRQCEERDRQIRRLLDELAERPPEE